MGVARISGHAQRVEFRRHQSRRVEGLFVTESGKGITSSPSGVPRQPTQTIAETAPITPPGQRRQPHLDDVGIAQDVPSRDDGLGDTGVVVGEMVFEPVPFTLRISRVASMLAVVIEQTVTQDLNETAPRTECRGHHGARHRPGQTEQGESRGTR